MGRLMIILFIGLLVVAPVVMPASTEKGGNWMDWLKPVGVILLLPVVKRLFQWLGMEIGDSQIEALLVRIIEWIVAAEKKHGNISGEERKKIVTNTVVAMLSRREVNALVKKYGSIETAVQAAYEISSIAQRSNAIGFVVKNKNEGGK